MKNWERLFKPHILERGYEYFLEERVVDIRVQENLIEASVAGIDDYEVVIEGVEHQYPRFYCGCPYADGETNCKHMAAVLYEYEDGKSDERWEVKEILSEKVEKVVLDAEDKVVRDFLIELLEKDQNLAQRFTRLVSPKITDKDVQQLKHRVDKIIQRNAGYENYLEFDQIEKFVADLMKIIDEDIIPLIEKKAYLAAFQLIRHIILKVREIDIDDLEGELFEVSAECQYILEEILEKATTQEKANMYSWFKVQLEHSNGYFGDDEIEQVCEKYF